MCTRFVCCGEDVLTGFNFDIDLAVWNHKVITKTDGFYIGILRPDGVYHSYHGVNQNGNAGTLLYVHGNSAGAYRSDPNCITIADLTERFIKGQLSFAEALHLVRTKHITYAPDATMQAMLSDKQGQVLIIEPGIGYRQAEGPYALITNYSLLKPESTKAFIVPGDDRYQRALRQLKQTPCLSVADAFALLQSVRQEGPWATRVSFVYTAKEQAVYYAENNDFAHIKKFVFPAAKQAEV
ncbi:MAG: conjugal transfer protein [Peptococcaceae bacterium]